MERSVWRMSMDVIAAMFGTRMHSAVEDTPGREAFVRPPPPASTTPSSKPETNDVTS